jgi:hypothetical protein
MGASRRGGKRATRPEPKTFFRLKPIAYLTIIIIEALGVGRIVLKATSEDNR